MVNFRRMCIQFFVFFLLILFIFRNKFNQLMEFFIFFVLDFIVRFFLCIGGEIFILSLFFFLALDLALLFLFFILILLIFILFFYYNHMIRIQINWSDFLLKNVI